MYCLQRCCHHKRYLSKCLQRYSRHSSTQDGIKFHESENTSVPPDTNGEISTQSQVPKSSDTNIPIFPLMKEPGFKKKDWNIAAKKSGRLPSVTKILQDTMPIQNAIMLLKWKQKMIAELGEKGFIKFNEETLAAGSALHRCIQQYLQGIPMNEINVGKANAGHWKSMASILPQITDVYATEKYVKHPMLSYAGYIDCIATYKGKLCVIDWKTSTKPKPTLLKCYDSPLQTAAYTGATNFDDSINVQVVDTLLVIAYKNGTEAHVHYMPKKTSQYFWEKWLSRLHMYRLMKASEKEALDI
ncbi:mitochondrial genome maintenance exonuclease 1-like [Saccoglossus kowalevskii]|uniref:Mitochondrial genome maintenance exonuclease 1 n=1 Tax=Saccoglossus kowalevskii TaxID=10224 RepID=A0ABM0GV70_SACKO|nr:PREDICTED: mitochondrial genome maintenance exonuclease 1-like [Saccoglossus kowalevskii]